MFIVLFKNKLQLLFRKLKKLRQNQKRKPKTENESKNMKIKN